MIDVLEKQLILSAFPDVDIYLPDSIDSTNQFLKSMPNKNNTALCVAEMQTNGRGRFGRPWDSPFGLNLYMSISFSFDKPLSKLSGLSLAMGLSLYQVLKTVMPETMFKLKWPNDVYVHHNKIAGILIELQQISEKLSHVIIGIGLNVNEINMPVGRTSLKAEDGKIKNRTKLLIKLIQNIITDWQSFKHHGFSPLVDAWNNADLLTGQQIDIIHNQQRLNGKSLGVNHEGNLLLLDDLNVVHTIHAGVASLSKDSYTND